MKKKSGTAGSPIDPVAPAEAQEADVADPGEVAKLKAEQRQTKTGKYGTEKNQPFKPDEDKQKDSKKDDEEEKKKSWIEVELVGEDGKPIPGERYKITLPDGKTAAEGTLDQKGFVRVEGFEPGQCKVTFPDLDKET